MTRFPAKAPILAAVLLALGLLALPGCVAYSDSYYGGGGYQRRGHAYGAAAGGWGHRPPGPPPRYYGYR